MISKIVGKLRDHAYRSAFVASQINIGIPFQIKALMKTRGWTQEKLAERTGMLQPRISAILKPGKVRPNIETLRRIAEAFDCGLLVRFAPFSELARWSDSFDPEQFNVPAFDNDLGFKEPAVKELEPEKTAASPVQPARLQGLSLIGSAKLDLDLPWRTQHAHANVLKGGLIAINPYAQLGARGLSLQELAGVANPNIPAQEAVDEVNGIHLVVKNDVRRQGALVSNPSPVKTPAVATGLLRSDYMPLPKPA